MRVSSQRTALLTCGVALWAATAVGQTLPPGPLTRETVERMALERHPAVARAAARVRVAQGQERQAGLWPNPVIGYAAEEVSGGPVNRGGEHGVFVEQTVPLGGKLRLRKAVLTEAISYAEASADVAQVAVRTAARARFADALVASHRVRVRERLLTLAEEAVVVSRQLFNTGAADEPDVLASENERQRAGQAVVEARNAEAAAFRRLGVAMGLSGLEPRPLAQDDPAAVPDLARDAVWTAIKAGSPMLAVARKAVDRADAEVVRERREPFPDLVVRGGPLYNRELLEPNLQPVGWEAQLQVGITVPLFDRNQGGIAASVAAGEAARAELRQVELVLEDAFASSYETYLTSFRAAERYRDEIVPRAEKALALYLASYQQMAAAYPQVLLAQRTLIQSVDEYLAALSTTWREAVRLEGLLADADMEAVGR